MRKTIEAMDWSDQGGSPGPSPQPWRLNAVSKATMELRSLATTGFGHFECDGRHPRILAGRKCQKILYLPLAM